MPFPRSISESSFLLIQPAPTSSPTAPLPSFSARFRSILLASSSYSLPLLALADLLCTLVLGVLIAGRDEADLITWGVVRAGVVLWVGWTGSGGRRFGGGRSGGGWIASTSMISLLLVFWQINFLTQTRNDPPRLSPRRNAFTLDPFYGSNDKSSTSVTTLANRHVTPHFVFLLTTMIFSFLEYTLYLTLLKLLPQPTYLGKRSAFAVRPPRQTAAHYSYSSERVSVSPLTSPTHLQPPSDPFLSPTSLHAPSSSSRYHPSSPLSHPRNNPNDDDAVADEGEEEEEEPFGQLPSSSSDSELSDDEIIDIPPPSKLLSPHRPHASSSTSRYRPASRLTPLDLEEGGQGDPDLVVGEEGDEGYEEERQGTLERGLARSWTRREVRRLRERGQDGAVPKVGEVGYGTFERE